MKVENCLNSQNPTVTPEIYNDCTFVKVDTWNENDYPKTCDVLYYLADGSGTYIYDCDDGWTFLGIHDLKVSSPDKTIGVDQDNKSLLKDDINIKLKVNISSDELNIITRGTDGGLYASITPDIETSTKFTIVSDLGYPDVQGFYSETLATFNTKITLNQEALETILIDNEIVVAHILEPEAFPVTQQTISATFVSGTNTAGSIDLSIPVLVIIKTDGTITITELAPIIPANSFNLSLSNGTVISYPRVSSTLIQADGTVIQSASFIINGTSWNIQGGSNDEY